MDAPLVQLSEQFSVFVVFSLLCIGSEVVFVVSIICVYVYGH